MYNVKGIKSIVTAILMIVFLTTLSATARAEWKHRGFSLPLWVSDISEVDDILDDMADKGVSSVKIAIWWFQEDIYSSVVAPVYEPNPHSCWNYSVSDEVTIAVIRKAQDRNMRVMLSPMLDPETGGRDEIVGGNSWFNDTNGYGDYIRHFAEIAEQESVELFCVGTELWATQTQETNWRALIADVRQLFSGELVYAQGVHTELHIVDFGWWDALDYFGVNAYYDIVQVDPSWSEVYDEWVGHLSNIKAARDAIDPQKKVIFTEGGCLSINGGAQMVYDPAEPVDEQEQANYYKGMLEASWDADWLLGCYFWNWEVKSYFIDPKGWSIQGKLAAGTLAEYYYNEADLSDDGCVNLVDFGLFASHWLEGYIESLVPNTDFEATVPTAVDWFPSGDEASYNAIGGNPGGYVEIEATSGGGRWDSASFAIDADTEYTLAFDYKSTEIQSWVEIVFYKDNGATWVGKYELYDEILWGIPSLDITSEWTNKSGTFTSHIEATSAIVTLCFFENGHSNFDNVTVIDAGSVNIVPNADFEATSPIVADWTPSGPEASYCATGGNPGGYVEIEATSGGGRWDSASFAVDGNTEYTLALDYKSTEIHSWVEIVSYKDNGATWVGKYELYDEIAWGLPSLYTVSEWTNKSGTFTSPADATSAIVTLRFWESGHSCFDNVIVTTDEIETGAFSSNQLPNSSFEKEDPLGTGPWDAEYWWNGDRTDDTAHNGSWSIKIPATGSGWPNIPYNLNFEADVSGYKFRTEAYLEHLSSDPLQEGQSGILKMDFCDNDANSIAYVLEEVLLPSDPCDEWKLGFIEGIAPAGTTQISTQLVMKQASGVTIGTVYFDDFSFQMMMPILGENTLANAGFEIEGSGGPTTAQSWTHFDNGTAHRIDNTARSGTWSMKLRSDDDDSNYMCVWQKNFYGEDVAGEVFDLTAFLKYMSDDQIGVYQSILWKVLYYDMVDQLITTPYQKVMSSADPADTWKQCNRVCVAPDGTAKIMVEIMTQSYPGDDRGSVYIDDLSLVARKKITGDFDTDLDVDFDDLLVFAEEWLNGCIVE